MTEQLMITLLNMSFSAAVMTVIVMIIRLFIRRLPKWYSYALWGLVLFRLVCPVSISSSISLFPASVPISKQIAVEQVPSIHSGLLLIDLPVNHVLETTMTAKAEDASITPIQYALYIFLIIWGIGFILFFSFNMAIYIKMKYDLRMAVKREYGVFESDGIAMPMVLGTIRPIIYLPLEMTEGERECVLIHERVHIKRRDHLVKQLGFLALAVHWFNPFVWLTFRKMCEDMEMSCDEKVLEKLGNEGRSDYSMALLQFSARKSGLFVPLAFGESHTKSRIKNILNSKKPVFLIRVAAVAGLVCAAVVFLTNPKPSSSLIDIIGGADGPTSIFIAGKTDGEANTIEAVPISPQEMKDMLLKGTNLMLDSVSEERAVLHGSFGICVYEMEKGTWNMTGSVNMEKVDERYGNASYFEKVFDMGDQLLIGFKKDGFYDEKGYLFNIADGTLIEIDEASELLSLTEQNFPTSPSNYSTE